MDKEKTLERYMSIIVPCIRTYLPDCTIYLFGSRAKKTDQSGSDVDIALDNETTIPFKIILNILNDLDDSQMPVWVDVVDLHDVSDQMKDQIITHGIIWKKS